MEGPFGRMTRRELLRRLALFGAAGYALDRFGGELLAAVAKPLVVVAPQGRPAGVAAPPVAPPPRQFSDVNGISPAARAAGAVVIPSSEASQFEPVSIRRG